MARAAAIVLAAALLAVGARAARPEPAVNAGHWASLDGAGLTDFGYSDLIAREERGDGNSEFPFRLLTKFVVRPSIQKEFVKGWLKYREDAQDAKGAKAVGLSKPLSDNLLFYGYEEWESKADFFKWIKSEDGAAKKLAGYIEEKDIPIVLTQLLRITRPERHHGHHHKGASLDVRAAGLGTAAEAVAELLGDVTDSVQDYMPEMTAGRRLLAANKGGKGDFKPIILSKFIVKPSEVFRFVAAANLFTEAVAEHDKGANNFVFTKTTGDDTLFYAYAEWESKGAIAKHAKSEHSKLFRQYVLDHDVFVKNELLFAVEKLDD